MEFRLGTIREERNIPRQYLAPLIGVAVNTLCDYENGRKRPSYEKLITIAKELQISLDYLTGLTDDQSANSRVAIHVQSSVHPGSYIRRIRRSKDVSIQEASRETSFDAESFALMEAGQIPLPVSDLKTIAENTGMSEDEFRKLMNIVCDEENYSFLSNGLFLKTNRRAAEIIRLIIILKDNADILDEIYRYIKKKCAEP